jgi:cold-inducible RNA-binding protein
MLRKARRTTAGVAVARQLTWSALRGHEEITVGKKLFVGNLAFEVTQADLEELFAGSGTCESVAVIMDRDTGRSRGFGFVEMSSPAEAQAAIKEFDGKDLKGRALKVNEANDRGATRPANGSAGRRF